MLLELLALGALGALAMQRRGGKVHHLERAAALAEPLQQFVSWWDAHGPFPVTIPDTGGLRTSEAEQLELFMRGVSNAKRLADTPHGRGGAVDLLPAKLSSSGVVVGIYTEELDGEEASRRYRMLADLGEAHGLVSGGIRWGWDWPHLELADWRALPFPPTGGVA